MARPRKSESIDTKKALSDAAIAAFAANGFQRTALDEIASTVGVSRTTLLYHYKSKTNLYNEIVSQAFANLSKALLDSIAIGGSMNTRVKRVLKSFLSHVEANPELSKLLLRELIAEDTDGAQLIIDKGLPILEIVEDFMAELGQLRKSQRPMLREVLIQITSSIIVKSSCGSLRTKIWGGSDRTVELAYTLLEGLLSANKA